MENQDENPVQAPAAPDDCSAMYQSPRQAAAEPPDEPSAAQLFLSHIYEPKNSYFD